MEITRPETQERYGNYIGGEWVPPVSGNYFPNHSPIDGALIGDFPRSDAKDVDLACDAAERAASGWALTSPTERSNILLKMADRIEQNAQGPSTTT